MVFLPNLGVNQRVCLCDVASYVSAQPLDFLDLGQKPAFLDWKHCLVPKLVSTDIWIGTSYNLLLSHDRQRVSNSRW
jgi:hypothetical protein